MQKKIIALAIAGVVSGAAFAQSNVIVYGVADYAYEYSDGKRGSYSGVVANGRSNERIGFKGEEDLGGGLKAIFIHEFQVDADRAGNLGNGLNSTRKSVLGIKGSWGTIQAGRQAMPSDYFVSKTNASGNGYIHAHKLLLTPAVQQTEGTIEGDFYRRNNTVLYDSPVWNGWNTIAAYSFGEANREPSPTDPDQNYNQSNEKDSAFGWGVGYNANNLRLVLAYQTLLGQRDLTPPNRGGKREGKNTQEFILGASYNFGIMTLGTGWTHSNNVAKGKKADVYYVSAKVPVGKQGRFITEVAQSKIKAKDWAVSAPRFPTARADIIKENGQAWLTNRNNNLLDGGKATAFSVGYEHDLSKRTMFYSAVSYMKNNENSTNLGGGGTGYQQIAQPNSDAWGVMVGLSHTF